jgi:DNA-binding transcriptional ArsR family regulator
MKSLLILIGIRFPMRGKGDILFHPVRLRTVQALFGGRRLSARQLLAGVRGASIATLYRHLNCLVRAGVVTVVERRQARGATERIYALAGRRAADISKSELRRMRRADLLRHFTTFLAALLHDYEHYLDQPDFDIGDDGALVRQEAVYLTAAEARRAAAAIRKAVAADMRNAPGRRRRRYFVTTIMHPDAGTAATCEPPEPREPSS